MWHWENHKCVSSICCTNSGKAALASPVFKSSVRYLSFFLLKDLCKRFCTNLFKFVHKGRAEADDKSAGPIVQSCLSRTGSGSADGIEDAYVYGWIQRLGNRHRLFFVCVSISKLNTSDNKDVSSSRNFAQHQPFHLPLFLCLSRKLKRYTFTTCLRSEVTCQKKKTILRHVCIAIYKTKVLAIIDKAKYKYGYIRLFFCSTPSLH